LIGFIFPAQPYFLTSVKTLYRVEYKHGLDSTRTEQLKVLFY